MRVLFISRKHPPSVGGMERLSYQLVHGARRYADVRAVTWGRSQACLPFFVGYALLMGIWEAIRGVDLIHIGDPVISPLGWLLGKLRRVPVVTTAHGLDVTFPRRWYQRWIPGYFLPRLDHIVCISHSTEDACVARGIRSDMCEVITPGVDIPRDLVSNTEARSWLSDYTGTSLGDRRVLLTTGRLVPRKGVTWFVENVLTRLLAEHDLVYVVVGQGEERPVLDSLVEKYDLARSVCAVGRLSDENLHRAYAAADLFIMPNIPVPGDMEGFGLVALEAAAHGVPVVAADLEGVRDAVLPDLTGKLLPVADPEIWASELAALLRSPDRLRAWRSTARETVTERCTWEHMVEAYMRVFEEVVAGV